VARLKRNDTVLVITGRDQGKKGKILRLFPRRNRALVEGVHLVKKHLRPTRDNPQGGIATVEGTISVSNLMLICPRCSKKTRVGFTILTDGTKRRMCKKCNEII
jgi:large subunit ribosomal protein L24